MEGHISVPVMLRSVIVVLPYNKIQQRYCFYLSTLISQYSPHPSLVSPSSSNIHTVPMTSNPTTQPNHQSAVEGTAAFLSLILSLSSLFSLTPLLLSSSPPLLLSSSSSLPSFPPSLLPSFPPSPSLLCSSYSSYSSYSSLVSLPFLLNPLVISLF